MEAGSALELKLAQNVKRKAPAHFLLYIVCATQQEAAAASPPLAMQQPSPESERPTDHHSRISCIADWIASVDGMEETEQSGCLEDF